MKRSTHHILTTHTGSLPRPTDLLLRAKRKYRAPQDLGAMDLPHLVLRQRDGRSRLFLSLSVVAAHAAAVIFPRTSKAGIKFSSSIR